MNDMPAERPETRAGRSASGWFGGAGLASSLAALVGASCCVLPIILINLGAGSALVANLAWFARARDPLMAAALVLIAGGLVLTMLSGRPRPRVLIMFGAAALITGLAWIMPYYEDAILRFLGMR